MALSIPVWYRISGSRNRFAPAALPIWIPLARPFRLFDAGLLSRGTMAALVRYAARAALGREWQRTLSGRRTKRGQAEGLLPRAAGLAACFNGPTDTCSTKLQCMMLKGPSSWPPIAGGWVADFHGGWYGCGQPTRACAPPSSTHTDIAFERVPHWGLTV